MGLLQVNNHLVTAGNEVQTVTLTGINTDDVYLLTGNNIQVGASGGVCDIYATTGGSQNTTTNHKIAWMDLNSTSTFQKFGNATGQSMWRVTDGMGVLPTSANFIMNLYNFNSSTEYSFITMDVTSYNGSKLRGYQQGGAKTETTAHDGVYINTNQSGGGGFQAGSQFTLFKVI